MFDLFSGGSKESRWERFLAWPPKNPAGRFLSSSIFFYGMVALVVLLHVFRPHNEAEAHARWQYVAIGLGFVVVKVVFDDIFPRIRKRNQSDREN
jgi:hypothetical protein